MSFLLSAIQWWSDNEPERPALEYLDKVYTYADLRHRIELAARLFKDRGVSAGACAGAVSALHAIFKDVAQKA